ncbi:MAG TPA: TRAP transporter substrate-binding protein DctP [Dehalococcoidia bacterium]|nr:TRAP transporter substrate-binding protein DctP [Dehalococcoidia bacterium]
MGLLVVAIVLVAACAPATEPTPGTAAPNPEASKVYVLKMQALAAPGEMWRMEPLQQRLTEMSKGRLKIKAFSSGEIVPTVEILDAVASGVLDMGWFCGAYVSDKIPIAAVEFGLPFSWTDVGLDVYNIFWERGLLDLVREAYGEHGVYYVGPVHTAPYSLLAKTEARGIEDLRKMKIRSTGITAKALNNAGIPTVYVPVEETYVALATGTIDGVVYGGAGDYRDTKFYEVAKYYYRPPIMASSTCNVLVNMDVWNSLPSDLQAILVYGTSDYSQWMAFNYLDFEYQALEEMGKQGLKVVTLPDETVAELVEAALPLWDEVAASSPRAAKGVEIVKDWFRTKGVIE